MFYGLNNFVKNLLPKRLFYRALLIVAVPIIVLQVVISIVFFDSLWIKTNKGMTRALIGEMKTFLMITIAILFLKNQTRPIINLAKAAERFGKGENIDEYRPSGALEIRQAGLEFDKMRKRIMRHLNQRSEMLSGISHDLRTPLTRLKLQLSFMKDKDLSKKMSLDIDEMEKMLNEYLQFTSSSYLEKDETFDISELIETTINNYNNDKITKEIIPRIYMNGRKNLIQRSINNLIDNSIKYAENINFHLSKKAS